MRAPFSFRPLTRADLPLLHEWLNRPHVAEWWEGATSFEYVEQTHGADLDSDLIWQYLACLDGVPVGYVQLYRVLGADPDWWQDETARLVAGVPEHPRMLRLLRYADSHRVSSPDLRPLVALARSEMLRQFLAHTFEDDPSVTKIQTDPAPRNGRAIRAYEKAGFRRVREVKTPDGAALLMVVTRAEFARG